MALPIYLKRSSVANATPDPNKIVYGELCVNYNNTNPFIAFKTSSNNIVKLTPWTGTVPSLNVTGQITADNVNFSTAVIQDSTAILSSMYCLGVGISIDSEGAFGQFTDVDESGFLCIPKGVTETNIIAYNGESSTLNFGYFTGTGITDTVVTTLFTISSVESVLATSLIINDSLVVEGSLDVQGGGFLAGNITFSDKTYFNTGINVNGASLTIDNLSYIVTSRNRSIVFGNDVNYRAAIGYNYSSNEISILSTTNKFGVYFGNSGSNTIFSGNYASVPTDKSKSFTVTNTDIRHNDVPILKQGQVVNPNLLLDSQFANISVVSDRSTYGCVLSNDTTSRAVKIATNNSGYASWYYDLHNRNSQNSWNMFTPLTGGKKYTVSMKVKVNANFINRVAQYGETSISVLQLLYSNDGRSNNGGNTNTGVSTKLTVADKWYDVSYTFTQPTSYPYLQIRLFRGGFNPGSIEYAVTVKHIKLEEGEAASTWVPHWADAVIGNLDANDPNYIQYIEK